MAIDILQMVIVMVLIMAVVVPLGRYMAAVFMGHHTWLDRVLDPVDNAVYRISGVKKDEGMRWQGYIKAMLLTNLAMFVMQFIILEIQHLAAFGALNPDGLGMVNPFLAFNTAASFITNTNWQNYGGENTLSYMSQMFAIIFPQFTSAATGLACGVAFIRGLGGSTNLGNFYVDLTRAITRIMLPIAFVAAVVFVGHGHPGHLRRRLSGQHAERPAHTAGGDARAIRFGFGAPRPAAASAPGRQPHAGGNPGASHRYLPGPAGD